MCVCVCVCAPENYTLHRHDDFYKYSVILIE